MRLSGVAPAAFALARAARIARLAATVLVALAVAPVPARAWTVEEHRLLADSALTRACAGWRVEEEWALRAAAGPGWEVAGRQGGNAGRRGAAAGRPGRTPGDPGRDAGTSSLLDAMGFASICAWSARDDQAMARRHERGRTVLEQLRPLTAHRLDSLAGLAERGDSLLLGPSERRAAARLRRLASKNPVASFLQHHLTALRLARLAGERARPAPAGSLPAPLLRRALVYEAIAQGYLADAFAAGHLMTPAGARPAGYDPVNLRRAHDLHARLGAYVLDGRGETWQTFGDRLLLWYGPSFAHVFEASVTALRELLLVHHLARGTGPPDPLAAWSDSIASAQGSTRERLVADWTSSREGPEYLAAVRLPSLVLIPTPVVATWSVRTAARDEHGLAFRRHAPQLAESGGHDPTLERRDVARLPSRAAVPGWMVPDTLFRADPLALVREHPEFASVRFAQASEPTPSYAGVIVFAGAVRHDAASGGGTDRALGVGFSPLGESSLLLDRISADLVLLGSTRGSRPGSILARLGASAALPRFGVWREPGLRWLDRVRFEAGHAWTRGEAVRANGNHYAVGLESPTIPLHVVYTGLTLRLGYQWTSLVRPRRGLAMGVVIQ